MLRNAFAIISLIALITLVPLTPQATRAADAPPEPVRAKAAPDPKADAELVKTAQGMFKDLKTVTLDNGLRVYLLPVKNAPVVTTMVAYRVGACDEDKDQTGLSHYLEH